MTKNDIPSESRIKIIQWEHERDRNLSIHCGLVANKYQRLINKEYKKYGKEVNDK